MKHVLHVFTTPNDLFAEAITRLQASEPDLECRIIDLTRANVDYDQLLREIFEADSVQVW